MFTNKTAIRSVLLSMVLASTSLCALGQITEPPRPRNAQAMDAVASAHAHPNLSGIKVQDIDQPARAPFQVTVPVNVNNFNYTPVTIPTGQRLVIDYISMAGAAASSAGPIQPIVILSAATTGNPGALFYIAPQPSAGLSTQFYHTESPTIYADSLMVGPAFAGYSPDYMTFNVVISGHLISNP